MNVHQRSYADESDNQAMLDLAREFAADNLHVIDLPYRLSSWALDESENVRLWFDEHENLVGWVVLQTPFWTIDYAFLPSLGAQLHREILSWADSRAGEIRDSSFGHPAWYVTVFENQLQRIRELEHSGFECQADVGENSWSQVLMRRSTPAPAKVYRPPSGYTVRALNGEVEVDAYVELHRSVFESTNMTVDWRLRTLRHPAYRPDLDIIVAAPDGHPVAFCICWFDQQTLTGQIEPLGCHKDYRKYALGRVALSEGLHRLQTLGAKQIFVETDSYRNTASRFYEFFDFQVLKNVLVYRKNYVE